MEATAPLGIGKVSFDQGAFGYLCKSPTTIASNLDFEFFDEMREADVIEERKGRVKALGYGGPPKFGKQAHGVGNCLHEGVESPRAASRSPQNDRGAGMAPSCGKGPRAFQEGL